MSPLTRLRVAVVLPRNMRFSPNGATAIDLVAHDLALASRFRASTVIVAADCADPFRDVATSLLQPDRTIDLAATLPWRFASRVAALRPAVVVVHQHLPTAATVAARLAGVPVLLHAHGWPRRPRNGLDRWRRGRRYRRLAGVIHVSAACRDAFVAIWPDGVSAAVVPNALPLADWAPGAEREPTIVLACRLSPEKKAIEAAAALAAALPALPGWRADLFGATGGSDPRYVAAVAAALAPLGERARLHLDRPHAAVKAAFERAAIAVFPQDGREAFGRVAIEAFAGGAALAATPGGGLDEVVGDAALPIEGATAAAIQAAILRLAGDPELRAKLARRGLERVRRFDIAAAASRYDDILEAVSRGEGLPAGSGQERTLT